MADICFITTCMGRLEHLQQSLPAAVAQPGCTCVVVDYSCPQGCGAWVEQFFPDVKVVRVPGQTCLRLSHARNAGARAADASWLCFLDADVILLPDFAERIGPLMQPGHFLVVQPWQRELTGTALCPRSAFEQIGGYDELLQGAGEEDVDLYNRLALSGWTMQGYPKEWLRPIKHDDALRVQHYTIKNPAVSGAINLLYRLAKFDLMRLLGRNLREEELRALYAQANLQVEQFLRAPQQITWQVQFRQLGTNLGPEIKSTLTYTLQAPKK